MNSHSKTGLLIQFPVSKSLPVNRDMTDVHARSLLTVKELASRYGLSLSGIYEFIKHDPTFPYKNVGLKKKYMVDAVEFEKWINDRTQHEKKRSFNLPSATDLLERYKR